MVSNLNIKNKYLYIVYTMPRRKTYRKKRRARKSYAVSRVGITPGMPATRRAVLRVCISFSLTSTTGAISAQSLLANGCFDPTEGLSARSPMGWDTWNQLYKTYVVLGSKASIRTVHSSGASSYSPAICGVVINNDNSTPYLNYQGFVESKKGSYRMLDTHPKSASVVKSFYSAKKFFNVTDIKDNMDRLGALVSADPSESAHYVIWYQTLNGATQTQDFLATIDYIVDFSEPAIGVES